jgi:hypothetical protein
MSETVERSRKLALALFPLTLYAPSLPPFLNYQAADAYPTSLSFPLAFLPVQTLVSSRQPPHHRPRQTLRPDPQRHCRLRHALLSPRPGWRPSCNRASRAESVPRLPGAPRSVHVQGARTEARPCHLQRGLRQGSQDGQDADQEQAGQAEREHRQSFLACLCLLPSLGLSAEEKREGI